MSYLTESQKNIADSLFEKAKEQLQKDIEKVSVTRNEKQLNNGATEDQIVVRVGSSIVGPAINLEPFVIGIDEGRIDEQQAMNRINSIALENAQKQIMLPAFNRESAKEHFMGHVVNAEYNSEMLKNVPCYRIPNTDLAAIVRFHLDLENGEKGSFIVNNQQLPAFAITSNEACEFGMANITKQETEILSMQEVLMKRFGVDLDEEDFFQMAADSKEMNAPFLVITNESVGAGSVFLDEHVRERIYEKVGGEYYILPSSIYETLAVKADGMNSDDLEAMVKSVNATEVAPEEVLSNHVYFVNDKLEISMVGVDLSDEILDADALNDTFSVHL